MSYPKIIIVASHIPILAAALFAIFFYRKLQVSGQTFCWFIFVSCVIQMSSLACWFMMVNNMPMLHIYVPVGFALLAWFYRRLLGDDINGRIIWVAVGVFAVGSLLNSIFLQPIHSFNSIALTVESVLVLILSIFTFIVQLNRSRVGGESKNWAGIGRINSGLFIYYTSTMVLFYFGSSIMKFYSIDISAYIWVFHAFFSTVMYCCFIAGLWKQAAAYR